MMIKQILAIIGIMILLCSPVVSVSVYEYGTNYIIWNVTGDNVVYSRGESINVTGIQYYSQYELQPDTEHILCNTTGCIGVTTEPDAYSIFLYWGVFLIMIGFVVIAYRYPISGFPCLIFGIYVLTIYLPSISAGSSEYILTGVLIAVGMAASWYGMYK